VKRIVLLIITSVILSGCATYHKTIPDEYAGPTATIQDTAKVADSGKADFFYLSYIDGKRIEDSRIKSMVASHGLGNYLKIVLLENSVPSEEHIFTIVGRTEYAMPIRALAETVFEVKGDITFTPQANEKYVIKGSLTEERSLVWLEKESSGEVIDQIEIIGSSALGFWSK
jgi:hypothetical protein